MFRIPLATVMLAAVPGRPVLGREPEPFGVRSGSD